MSIDLRHHRVARIARCHRNITHHESHTVLSSLSCGIVTTPFEGVKAMRVRGFTLIELLVVIAII